MKPEWIAPDSPFFPFPEGREFFHYSAHEFTEFDKSRQATEPAFFFWSLRNKKKTEGEFACFEHKMRITAKKVMKVNMFGLHYDSGHLRQCIEDAKRSGAEALMVIGMKDPLSWPSNPTETQYLVFEPDHIEHLELRRPNEPETKHRARSRMKP